MRAMFFTIWQVRPRCPPLDPFVSSFSDFQTRTKLINLANPKGQRQYDEPMK